VKGEPPNKRNVEVEEVYRDYPIPRFTNKICPMPCQLANFIDTPYYERIQNFKNQFEVRSAEI
jgi:hypothetical protein